MRQQPRLLQAGTLVLALLVPATLHAQFGIAARASTLGLGAELSYRVNRNIGIRVGGNYLQFSRDATIKEIDYHLTPHFENGTVTLDLFPIGGAFHVSGGFLFNHNEGRMVARLNQNIQIGNTTYTPDEVGSLIGTVDFKKTAPYLGIGLAGRGKIAVLLDLGVGFTGTPRVDLVGVTPLTGPQKAQFDANVAQELAEVRAEIDDKKYLKYHPVLSLGFRIGF
ncbi:MAG TPA: hypothetical protein VFU23_00675 [Gemmatimonadales bacterium]|nr:hypothetical protein [Gemmatimonadales bacterium]